MNMHTLREHKNEDLMPVLWHGDCGSIGGDMPEDADPLDPRCLLMAYEDIIADKVTPVVSDFDCFLMGTRGVSYCDPYRKQEMTMLQWCVDKIEEVLSKPQPGKSWAQQWLDAKKMDINSPVAEEMPEFGYSVRRDTVLFSLSICYMPTHSLVSLILIAPLIRIRDRMQSQRGLSTG